VRKRFGLKDVVDQRPVFRSSKYRP
jgi:hypothetical protein